jgi:dGTPase
MKESENQKLNLIKYTLTNREVDQLSNYSVLNNNAVRRSSEAQFEGDYRLDFSIDSDRILHSRAYARYIDKTQVFYLIHNDHITHRVLHVQLVSKIARTIGRFLGLNEDLIEAIALGHDIGHAPFGHDGERFLSGICKAHGIGAFQHNVQSVQFLDKVERKGRGWNLCLQTLDGILCHDGEIHNKKLEPEKYKSFKIYDKKLNEKKKDPGRSLVPMTMEGCVVRLSDTIAYIGRDIEDAIRMNLIKRTDLPQDCVNCLGDTNGTIVFNLVTDIIKNSADKPYIAFSPEVSEALKKLKAFNLERIYLNPRIKQHTDTIGDLFKILFETYLVDIRKHNQLSVIFEQFLDGMSESYRLNHQPSEIVRDFIAGMTDQYFLRQCPEKLRPKIQRI